MTEQSEDAIFARGCPIALASCLLVATALACHPAQPEAREPREEVQVIRSALVSPTFVQVATAEPETVTTSISAPFVQAQTAGNLNVVMVSWGDATASVTTVTDSKGNVYNVGAPLTRNTAGALSETIYYAKSIASATAGANTVTVRFSPAATAPVLRILEYHNVDPNNPLDGFHAGTGNGGTPSSGSLTTTFPTDLLVAGSAVATGIRNPGTGFTRRVITANTGEIAEDRIATPAGPFSATATLTSSGQWLMEEVAFRALDNAAPTTPGSLTATAVAWNQINLSWTASTDDSGSATYSVESCQGASCSTFGSPIGTPSGTTFQSTGLTQATSYRFRVRAKDAAGNFSAYSNIAGATTQNHGCSTGADCSTGFCADGVCCNVACNGGCGVCNQTGSVGTCMPKANNASCRPTAGACDVAEVCNGSSLTCPTDAFLPSTTVCRAAAGVCDVAETCTGSSAACPTDSVAAAGTVCRAASDGCDAVEKCTGSSSACPTDLKAPDNTNCTDNNACTVVDRCQAGVCVPGPNVECPGDACHAVGTCDPGTGFCVGATPINEGQQCDDGNRCTLSSQCKLGVCVPEDPATGCTDPNGPYYAPLTNLGSRHGVSIAEDINNHHVVLGNDVHFNYAHDFSGSGEGIGFTWTANGGVQELPRPAGRTVSTWALNDNGDVVGTAWDPANPGSWVYHYDGTTGQFQGSQTAGWGMGINNNGRYTGEAVFDATGFKLYRAQGTTFTPIPIPSGMLSVNGRAIDASGTIFGSLQRAVSGPQAFVAIRHTDADPFRILGQLLPSGTDWDVDPVAGGAYLTAAYSTNGTQVVGTGMAGGGKTRGFVLSPANAAPGTATFKRIGVPSGTADDTAHVIIPYRINGLGTVVGTVADASNGPQRAFIWADGAGTVDLNTYVDPNSGWTLQSAIGINQFNEVVGVGLLNGQKRAFKMTVPQQSACPPPADPCHTGTGVRNNRGVCVYPNAPNGTACDDHNLCSLNDQCTAGTCAGVVLDCPGDACNAAGTCDPATGLCVNAVALDGIGCDDGNRCSIGDVCAHGTCMPGPTDNGCRQAPDDTYYVPVIGLGSTQAMSYARAINENGEIVGVDARSTFVPIWGGPLPAKAFSWTPNGTRTDIPAPVGFNPHPTGVNLSGVITGTAWNSASASQLFRFDPNGSPQYQPLPIPAGWSTGINDAGKITGHGYFTTAQGNVHSMFRLDGSVLKIVPGPAGDLFQYSNAIDPDGNLVGYTLRPDYSGHAVSYTDGDSVPEYLNSSVPVSSDWNADPVNGFNYLVSAEGTNGPKIVGYGVTGANLIRGFVMTPGTNGNPDTGSIQKIGMIPDFPANTSSWAVQPKDVNNQGYVVGSIYEGSNNYPMYAFVWTQATGTLNLNEFIDPQSGWQLAMAFAINDKRQVAGFGYLNGQGRAFTMTVPDLRPCNAPDACHTQAPRDLRTGECPAPAPITNIPACQEGITLRMDGVVDRGDGTFVALFGFNSIASASVAPSVNQVLVNDVVQTGYQPAPPTWLPPGSHPGAFLATFTSAQTISWRVDGQTVSASTSSALLPHVPIGSSGGYGVQVGGQIIPIRADVAQYSNAPPDPTPQPRPGTGAEYFGTLKGELSIAPSGAATYTLPIFVPHGKGGMAPNLSLVYNSQGGDGIAGQGWDLTGLSMIHRCPKNKPQDGYSTGLRFQDIDPNHHPVTDETLKDGICLDGKRLFERQTTGSLTYYEAESKDFTLITRELDVVGTPSFAVRMKSGETRYYGLLEIDRVDEVLNALHQPPVIWLLDKVVDAWGNYYDIHYNDDNLLTTVQTEGIKVTKISYTGHLPGDGEPAAPTYDIRFAYQDRSDVRNFRLDAVRVPKKSRLTTITTPAGYYSLSYLADDPMLPSRLQQIQYCQDAFHCLDPLVFDWTWAITGWNQEGDANEIGQANTYALPVRIDGHYDNGSNKPADWRSSGAQFIDLDSDGLVDLVFAMEDKPRAAWRNNGHGWDPAPAAWIPPVDLYKSDGRRANTLVVDFDGDGLPDFVAGRLCHIERFTALNSHGQPITRVQEVCDPQPPSPVVWLNHIKTGHGWERTDGYGTLPSGWDPVDFTVGDLLTDMNGDGRPDLLHIYQTDRGPWWKVLHNLPSGWAAPNVSYDPGPTVVYDVSPEDVNRDGLTDLVLNRKFHGAEGEVLLNTGSNASGGDGTNVFEYEFTANDTLFTEIRGAKYIGDIDGDGMRDSVMRYQDSGSPFNTHSGVLLGTWNGYSQAYAGTYSATLAALTPPHASGPSDPNTAFAIADVNGDGLGDLILEHDGVGQVLVNSGTNWVDLSGTLNAPTIPIVPSEWNPSTGGAFVDLNGDGIVDLVQATAGSGTLVTRAWINTARTPVIGNFPNGLARKTEVTYQVITTEEAHATGTYTDPVDLPEFTTYFTAPLRVASSVSAEDGRGVGALATTTYHYSTLRASATGRGPVGFQRMQVDEPEPSGVTTLTQFGMGYPYSGRPVFVGRYRRLASGDWLALATTSTTYCDDTDATQCSPPEGAGTRWAPRTSLFVYPQTVTTWTSALDSPGNIPEYVVTKSTFTYDNYGNNTVAAVETSEVRRQAGGDAVLDHYTKTTTSSFDGVNFSSAVRGQPSQTVVRTEHDGDPNSIVHTTAFHYQNRDTFTPPTPGSTLAPLGDGRAWPLVKTEVEPGAGAPIELHTLYDYDDFGNVITTTACASDFGSCALNAESPGDIPFRTQTVSYRVADYTPGGAVGAVTSLSYGNGEYPVKSTNAVGHVEYTAYDAVHGGLLQRTGPNGINTCYTYDRFGRQQTETVRCGLPTAATTNSQRYRATAGDPYTSAIVTITDSPDGSTVWEYTNDLGMVVSRRGRAFDGGFTEVAMVYDELGRKTSETKPRIIGRDQAYYTTTHYDDFGRVRSVTQDLGFVGDANVFMRDTTTTFYLGLAVASSHPVAGQGEVRTEFKNVLGKTRAVTTSIAGTIQYVYDAEGNLTQSQLPGGSVVNITYDQRGRKKTTQDPDLGTWTYEYDGFGDLTAQTDNKGQRTRMEYDGLGRMVTRIDATGGIADYAFDLASGAGVGKPAAMVSPNDDRMHGFCSIPFVTETSDRWSGRWFTYTANGQVDEEFECIDGQTFSTKHEYDSIGREIKVTYPQVGDTRLAIGYHYTSLGFLNYVSDASGAALWVAEDMNALGQVTAEHTANGVETWSARAPTTGWLMSRWSVAHADNENQIQGWGYKYDEAGNLRWRGRTDHVNPADSQETFGYDQLNRLISSDIDIPALSYHPPTQSYDYDALGLGNIQHKDGKTYTYGDCGAGPHAVCTVGGSPAFTYDANGSMTAGNGRNLHYDTLNKLVHIDEGGNSVELIYGADGNRVVQETHAAGAAPTATDRTVYVGMDAAGRSRYERTTGPSGVTHVQFIYAGNAHNGNAFALRVVSVSASTTTVAAKYNHFDHLGSITAVSNEQGQVISAAFGGPDAGVIGYDAWGARRNPVGTAADPASFHQQAGHREFTGHETIPGVGLINMNARAYDPVIGRFLSADPTVQFASDLQSYNRYSYVLNNPLRYTDSTGLSVDNWVRGTFGVVFAVAGIAACAGTGGAGCVMMSMVLMYETSISMASAGASFEQIVAANAIGMFSGAIGNGIGGLVGSGAAGALIGGAISGGINGAMTTAYGRWRYGSGGDLGTNVLEGAARGAVMAGVSAALGYQFAASQASAEAADGEGATKETTGEDARKRAADIRLAKDRAVFDGQVLRDKISGIPVTIYGETADDRQAAFDALKTDLTADCDESRSIVKALGNRRDGAGVRALEVVLVHSAGDIGSFSVPGSNEIVIDRWNVDDVYDSKVPGGRFTYARVLAHELGHAALGLHDDGPTYMNNVNKVENPIMRATGDKNDRMSY